MANVAFRLFRIEAHKNNAHKSLDDNGLLEGTSVKDIVMNAISDMQWKVLHHSPRVYVREEDILWQDEKPKDGDPCFAIGEVNKVFGDDRVFEIQIYKGRYGDLDYIVHNDKARRDIESDFQKLSDDIKSDAAVRLFLVRISFPMDKSCCYLAAQMRARSQACTDLFDQISFFLHKKAVKLVGHDVVQTGTWYHFITVPIVDSLRFDKALGKAEVESFKLIKHVVGSDGKRRQERVEVEYSKPSLVAKKKGLKILTNLAKHAQSGSSSYSPAISDIASLFPSNYLSLNNGDWEDGSITFSENQKQTKISALAISELFVYPLGDKAELVDLWNEANSCLSRIGETEGVIIPPIA